MKIINYGGKYKVYCAQSMFPDVLNVTSILTTHDIEFIAEATTYKNFTTNVKTILDNFSYRYPVAKVAHILADGVFTRKRDKTIGLSRKASGFNTRVSRMISNYALAEKLGIECHLRNKLLEIENAVNKAKLLGL